MGDGDLRFGRTVHSLIKALSAYEGIKVYLIAPEALRLPEYIRRLIVHSHPVLKPEIVFNDQRILYALGDIGKISSNLNQIAHHLNRSGMVTASLCSDIRNALAELFQMRNEIKKMAGKYRGNC